MGAASLILRANASEEIGAGHVMRLIALAQGARREGCSSHFVLGGDPGFCAAKVADAGFAASPSYEAIGSTADLEHLKSVAQANEAAAVVVDGYDFDTTYIGALAESCRTVVVDDLAEGHIPAHIVVNPNYGAEDLLYDVARGARVLAGSDYALLRSEFVDTRRPQYAASPLRLILTFGGSDPVNATTRVVRSLGAVQTTAEIRIVVGAGFRAREELSAAISSSVHPMEVLCDPANMAECLSWGNLAITAAGGTLWELSYLRLAVAAFSIVPNQDETARSLADRSMIFGGQRLQDLSDVELASILEKFLTDADTRNTYAARYHKLIDGRGAQRVMAEVLST
jgi:UDP-2,4-diacetamido-2,4,6-trideoxy-beta-L-altropyranose hydrolase